MALKSLAIIVLAFSCVYGVDITLHYNKQSNMTCAATLKTYNAGSIKCGVRCTEKYKDMCRGFVATGGTCQLCMVWVCQESDQQVLLSGNVFKLVTDITHGKIPYYCQYTNTIIYCCQLYFLLQSN